MRVCNEVRVQVCNGTAVKEVGRRRKRQHCPVGRGSSTVECPCVPERRATAAVGVVVVVDRRA